ncbi:MAG: hypothetical protein WCO11_01890 [Sphingomonadales bacterium]|jgi:hypothetical protein
MIRRSSLPALLIAALLSAPVSARERQVSFMAKAATSPAQRDADVADCRRIADKARGADMPAVDHATVGMPGGEAGLPGVAAGAIVALFFGMLEDGRAEERGASLCLENRGYVALPLLPDEQKTYLAQPPEKREAWQRQFLTRALDARIAEVARPRVPPLPDYREEGAMIGGLAFDLPGLVAAPDAVREGGSVLSGQLSRRRTAVLAADFASAGGPITIAGQAGAVFHQVDYRPQREPALRPPGATWCGPVEQRSAGGGAPSVYCLVSRRDGYAAYRPSGFAWLAGPPGAGFTLPMITAQVLLEERPADDLGPIAFTLVATQVRATHVVLTATAMRGNQKVRLWERKLKPGRDGKIIVPLWDRRLELALDPSLAVTARLVDGDGTSLRDAG